MAVHSLALSSLSEVSPDATYSADDTGVWTDSGVEVIASTDEADFGYAKLGTSSGWPTRHWFAAYTFADPPLLSTVAGVTVRTVFDSYSANANAVDLSLELFIIIDGVRYASDPIPVTGSTPTTGRQFREFDNTWSLNPATGASWSASDLASGTLVAGIRFRCTTDPAGAAVNLTGTGACVQELEVEVSGPAGANVETARHVASSHLLRHLEEFEIISVEVDWRYGDVGIMEPIWLASPSVPTYDGLGSGPEPARRLPCIVLQKTPRLLRKTWQLKLLNARTSAVSYWSPEVTDITADAQDNGIARFDMGGGWEVVRDQVGYARRPPEGLWVDRQKHAPRYHKEFGLAVHGGLQRWSSNNTFSQGSGGPGPLGLGIGTNYDGWSFSPDVAIAWDVGSTEAVRTEELFELLFVVPGLRRGVKLHNGYRPGYADVPIYAEYVWTVAMNHKVRAFMKYRPDYFGSSRPKWQLVRIAGGSGTTYFIPGTGWSATPTWNAPDQFGEPGVGPGIRNPSDTAAELPGSVWEEWWSEEIDVGVDHVTLKLRVGYSDHVSGAGVWPFMQTVIFGAAGLVDSNDNDHCWVRDFLVTTTSDLFQESDAPEINNDSDYRVWHTERGTVNFEFLPDWRHEDLGDGEVKFLKAAVHNSSRYDSIFYERTNASTGRYVFRRVNADGDEFDAEFVVSDDDLPAWRTAVKVAVIWTSDEEEVGLPARTHLIMIDRVEGTSVQLEGDLPEQVDGETKVLIGWAPGCTNDQVADGYFRHRRMRLEPLSVIELQRALDY